MFYYKLLRYDLKAVDQIKSFFDAFNIIDYVSLFIVISSVIIAVKLGLKKECLLSLVMFVPTAAAGFIPTEILEEYLLEVIVSKQAAKFVATIVIYFIFLFISIILKKNVEKNIRDESKLLSLDSFGGFIFGLIRGYLIIVFVIVGHAHFFAKPLQAMEKSVVIKAVKGHLLGIDSRFEEVFKHSDKVSKEIMKELNEENASKEHNSEKKGSAKVIDDEPIVDIDSDEANPEIEP